MVFAPIIATVVTLINTAAQVTPTTKTTFLSSSHPIAPTTETIITTTATPFTDTVITTSITSPTKTNTSSTIDVSTSSATDGTTSEATTTGGTSIFPTNGCPNLNFDFKGQGRYYPSAQGEVVEAVKIGDNQYEISYKFTADGCPSISNLDQAKLIGINSPESSSFILYDSNSNIKTIESSCDWTKKIVVNGQQTGSQVCIPSFQIHYAWFSGKASSDEASTWKYNGAYEYSVGCVHDNNDNSQNDLPLYCWNVDENTTPVGSETTTTLQSPVTTVSKATTTAEALAGPYDQCGGQNFNGATKCAQDWTCQSQNDYYYQCVESKTPTSTTSFSTSSITIATNTATKKTTTKKTTTKKTTTKKTTTKKTTTKKTTTTPTTTTPTTTTPTTTTPTTTTPTTTPATTQFVNPYGQCGGINYTGATQCVEYWSCQSQNDYYYQCVTAPLAATDTACGAMWAQCGGIGFNGYTKCCGGAVCVTQNEWYAQCTTTYKLI